MMAPSSKRKRGPDEKSETGPSTKTRKSMPTTAPHNGSSISGNFAKPNIGPLSTPEADNDVALPAAQSSSPSLASSDSRSGDTDDVDCDDDDDDNDDDDEDGVEGISLYSGGVL